jgi:glycerol uptake facilitator-like aquaporin
MFGRVRGGWITFVAIISTWRLWVASDLNPSVSLALAPAARLPVEVGARLHIGPLIGETLLCIVHLAVVAPDWTPRPAPL